MHSDFKIVSGGVHEEFARNVAKGLGRELVDIELKRFANGERYARFCESIRRDNLFIIQSFAEINGYSLNDALVETLLIVDAARRASAGEITVIFPYFPYARQDRKARNREPISVAVIIRMLEMVGVDRVVSVDLHSAQTQAIFDGPFDHLIARPLIIDALTELVKGSQDYVVVSPDAGRAKESEQYADELGLQLVHMPKTRDKHESSKISRPDFIEGIEGKNCIVIDDMIDTGGTIMSAAETMKKSGARSITVCATHGILSNGAAEKFADSAIDALYLANTIPQDENLKFLKSKLQVLSIEPLIAESIRRMEAGESLSMLFNDRNHK